MSRRTPAFEVVRSDAGWFARFRAANGQIVWVTESYTRRRRAVGAIDLLTSAGVGTAAAPGNIREVDERGQA